MTTASAPSGTQRFDILRLDDPIETTAQAFMQRRVPSHLGSLAESASQYLPSQELLDVLNTGAIVGAPVLLTGEPGTGKTQAAYYAAHRLGLTRPLTLDVNSETSVSDLFYRFDRIGYFHESKMDTLRPPGSAATASLAGGRDPMPFIQQGPLWKAFELSQQGKPSVVLIDEIDKAPRDFPNDLLNALNQHNFYVRELNRTIAGNLENPPLVMITSNSEKRLPEPLLRRCIYHYIPFDQEQMLRVVEKRAGGFPNLDAATRKLACERFLKLRDNDTLRKKPATGELLVWLTVLSARGGDVKRQLASDSAMSKLPAIHCLIKDRDDLAKLS